MTAGEWDITIEKGSTFTLSLTWQDSNGDPIDITGYSARMQVRQSVSDDTALLDLTSGGGDIVLGDAAGTIIVTVSDTDTAALVARRGVYDLEMESSGGVVTRLLEGTVLITEEVTR